VSDLRRRDRRIATWLGIAAFLAYLPFFRGHFVGTDEAGVFLAARSLYERGTLEVREGAHRFRGRGGRIYPHFAPGLVVLALPLCALGDAVARVLPEPWLARIQVRPEEPGRIDTLVSPEIFAVALYPLLASGVLVAVFYLLERRLGASVRSALAAAALLGGASYVATHSVYFLRHTTEAITTLAAFHALLAYRQEGRLRSLALGSLWASLTLLVAVPATVGVLPLGFYALWLLWPRLQAGSLPERARLLASAAAPALLVISVHIAVNQVLWGTWLESPMVAQRSHFSARLHVGLAGFLVSPGASVFVHSPLLLLLPWTLPPVWHAHRAECAVALASSLGTLLFCSAFESWPGLWSAPGPRYLFVVTPLLMLPLGPWLDTRRRAGVRALAWGLAVVGAGVQVVLLLARWSAVIRGMGYQKAFRDAGFAFLFVPTESPIVGSWRALVAGHVDPWLWGLARGSELRSGAPFAPAVLLALWCVALGLVLRRLRQLA
jgi:hypothetical protein